MVCSRKRYALANDKENQTLNKNIKGEEFNQAYINNKKLLESKFNDSNTKEASLNIHLKEIIKCLKSDPSNDAQLIGRMKETDLIAEFIFKGIKANQPRLVYISGSPGTGKTLCVNQFLRYIQLNKSWEYKTINNKKDKLPTNYNIITLNVAVIFNHIKSMNTPQHVSFFIYLAKTMDLSTPVQTKLKTVFKEDGFKLFLDYFKSKIKEKKNKYIIFIDEIDLLDIKQKGKGSKNAINIIYELFNFVLTECDFKITLLVISNTINLGKTICNQIIDINQQNEQVMFMVYKPYNHDTLKDIIMNKLESFNSNIISKYIKGIELSVRKIANTYGDCRRALDVCCQSIGAYIESLEENQNEESDIIQSDYTSNFTNLTNFQHILNRIHINKNTKLTVLKTLPLHHQYVTMAMVLALVDIYIEKNQHDIISESIFDSIIDRQITFANVETKYNWICEKLYTNKENFRDIMEYLELNNIICYTNNQSKKRRKTALEQLIKNKQVELLITPDNVILTLTKLPKVGQIFEKLLPY